MGSSDACPEASPDSDASADMSAAELSPSSGGRFSSPQAVSAAVMHNANPHIPSLPFPRLLPSPMPGQASCCLFPLSGPEYTSCPVSFLLPLLNMPSLAIPSFRIICSGRPFHCTKAHESFLLLPARQADAP